MYMQSLVEKMYMQSFVILTGLGVCSKRVHCKYITSPLTVILLKNVHAIIGRKNVHAIIGHTNGIRRLFKKSPL